MASDSDTDSEFLRKSYWITQSCKERAARIGARLEELEAENQRLWMVVDEFIDAVALAAPDRYQDIVDKARAALQPAPAGWEKV